MYSRKLKIERKSPKRTCITSKKLSKEFKIFFLTKIQLKVVFKIRCTRVDCKNLFPYSLVSTSKITKKTY